jgi:TRAP-type mannitol/chloroaromatic compound transport system permease small subunit
MKKIGKVVSLLMLPLIAEVVYSALKTYFLKDAPVWNFEITLFLYGTFFMLGGAYCHREKKHVSVEVVPQRAGPRTRRWLGIFSEAVVFCVMLVMIYVSAPLAWRSTLIGERSTHQTPFNPQVWWYRWVIPVSCAFMLWQSARDGFGLLMNKGTDLQREEKNNVP